MRYSETLIPTMKEVPSDAVTPSHVLMLRAGLIRKLASGIYEWLPLGLKVLNRVTSIIRKQHDVAGCLEVLLPAILPKSLWDETGRWAEYGPELMRFKDRQGREFCLGPTHEEAITELVRTYSRSYRDLPKIFYQIQTKYRDEIRPRFGVMRAREFIMKDAYSFDADEKGAAVSYEKMFNLYEKIAEELSLKAIPVLAKTGLIGGTKSHEFMVPSDEGEEEIVFCGSCRWGANQELARAGRPKNNSQGKAIALKEVPTPDARTVEEVSGFLKQEPSKFIKTLLYSAGNKNVCVLVRGDDSIDNAKLLTLLGGEPRLCTGPEIEKITGAPLGFSGPAGLKNIRIYADNFLKNCLNMVSGANKKDTHLININHPRDFDAEFADIRKVKEGDACPECGGKLKVMRGIEIAHTFYLGTKYSQKMKAVFTDKDGKERHVVMGCYGVGVSRIVAAVISQNHDEGGIVWPAAVSPYEVEIIPTTNSGVVFETAEELYGKLSKKFEVLIDDRGVSAGVKFKDADLIGIPVRIVIGPKRLKEKTCEIQVRKTGKAEVVTLAGVVKKVQDFI